MTTKKIAAEVQPGNHPGDIEQAQQREQTNQARPVSQIEGISPLAMEIIRRAEVTNVAATILSGILSNPHYMPNRDKVADALFYANAIVNRD
jgi:hypothetical protein